MSDENTPKDIKNLDFVCFLFLTKPNVNLNAKLLDIVWFKKLMVILQCRSHWLPWCFSSEQECTFEAII